MARLNAGELSLVLFGAAEARALMQAMAAPHGDSDSEETAKALRRAQIVGVGAAVVFGLVASAAIESAWPLLVAMLTAGLLAYEHEMAIRNQAGGVGGSVFGPPKDAA